MGRTPVTAALRLDSVNPGHVIMSVFIGRNIGARGHSGTLTLRTDEWHELGDLVDNRLLVEFELLDVPLAVLEGLRDADVAAGMPACRVCGCTAHAACPGGCYFVQDDLCSACADPAVVA